MSEAMTRQTVVLPWTFAALEPGDTMPLGSRQVVVVSVEEGEDGYLRAVVEDAPIRREGGR